MKKLVYMGKLRVKDTNRILCNRGVTYLDYGSFSVVYKYSFWFLQVNPSLVLPSMRRGHKRIIIVNGKRRGWCEMRYGMIPLDSYVLPGSGVGHFILRFIRKYLGFCLNTYERGYILVAIGRYRYVVTKRITRDGLCICEVFDKRTNRQIGNVVFNKEFSEVYVRTGLDGVIKTLCTIAGYIADSVVYNRAASALEASIKIIL